MYICFTFEDGGNPYIAKTNKELFRMLRKYYVEQRSPRSFHVGGEAVLASPYRTHKLSAYQQNRAHLVCIAREWQFDSRNMDYSYEELSEWQQFFEEYGKKYGLLREFRENGIC